MTTPAPRIAKIERTTKESDISVELNLDGTGIVDISTGVPFYVVDGRYGISGAQPPATFAQVLTQAWDDTHPRLQTVGGSDEACGPDGCAI